VKLASIEIISSLKPHENAERLQLAQIMGWQSVVQKDVYKEGDRVVFIVTDTLLTKAHWSLFLFNKQQLQSQEKMRLKTIKLRGQHSSGLVLPLSVLPKEFELANVGTDVTEILGIEKYIKSLPLNLRGEDKGQFPSHLISKTDEDNGLSNLEIVEEVLKSGPVVATQKYDGSSITVVIENGEITEVCSRNLSKKDTENSVYWKAAKKLKIIPGFSGIIQGELVGPNIQNNPMKFEDHEMVIFQVLKSNSEYMNYQEMKGFCNIELSCKVVPIAAELDLTQLTIQEGLNKLQELADSQYYSPNCVCEGIVVRPQTYKPFTTSRRPKGFKILNRNYKDN